MWLERTMTLNSGLNVINLDPTANIFKIINEDYSGSVLYMSTQSTVTSDRAEEKVSRGSSSSLVRTRPLGTVYVFNSGQPVSITTIEISSDDITFIFNASNQVQIAGQLESNGLKPTDLKRTGDNTLFVEDTKALAKLDTMIAKLEALIAKP